MPTSLRVVLVILATGCVTVPGPSSSAAPAEESVTSAASAQDLARFANLQVLPSDITEDELIEMMLENLLGLGLRRRGGEGCLHCHVGSMDEPREEWDYASDELAAKRTARTMMAMVRDINAHHLARLDDRSEPPIEVTCYTCHAGRTVPMPLADVLMQSYRSDGVAGLVETYRAARARYYAADAYDFRVGTLIRVADRIAERGDLAAAAAVHELNLELYDEPRAHGGLIRLRLVEALEASGIEAMIARHEELQGEHPAEAFGPGTLDPLAWQMFRGGRHDVGLRLFELNYAEHPDAFVSTESLGWAYVLGGQKSRGVAIARKWVQSHPDHGAGRTLLEDLESSSPE